MQIMDFSTTDGIQWLSECCCAFLQRVPCYCVLQRMLEQGKFPFDREANSHHHEDLTLEKGPKTSQVMGLGLNSDISCPALDNWFPFGVRVTLYLHLKTLTPIHENPLLHNVYSEPVLPWTLHCTEDGGNHKIRFTASCTKMSMYQRLNRDAQTKANKLCGQCKCDIFLNSSLKRQAVFEHVLIFQKVEENTLCLRVWM